MYYKNSFIVLFLLIVPFVSVAQPGTYVAHFVDTANLSTVANEIDQTFNAYYGQGVNRSTIETYLRRQLEKDTIGESCVMEIPYCVTCIPHTQLHLNNTLALRYYRDMVGVDSFQSTYFDITNTQKDSVTLVSPGALFEQIPSSLHKLFTFRIYCKGISSNLFIIIIDKDIDLSEALDDARNRVKFTSKGDPNIPLPQKLTQKRLHLFPNPANQRLQIRLQLQEASSGDIQLHLFNLLTGEIVQSHTYAALHKGTHTLTLDTSTLSSGHYGVEVNGPHFQQVEKLIVIH